MTDLRHQNKGRAKGTGHGGVKHYLTDPEVKAFIDCATSTGLKTALAFNLCYHFALRVGELVAIRLDDFGTRNTGNGEGLRMCLTIRALKGGDVVQPPVPDSIVDLLEGWLEERRADPANPFLFPSTVDPLGHATTGAFQAAFRVILKRAGITTAHSIHDLRHTCAHLLARKTKSLPQVAGWLRHKDPASAADYVGRVLMDEQADEVARMTRAVLR